jgi:hypothetical protein
VFRIELSKCLPYRYHNQIDVVTILSRKTYPLITYGVIHQQIDVVTPCPIAISNQHGVDIVAPLSN